MAQHLSLIAAMATQFLSFLLLAWCIIDYFKSNQFSVEQITIVLISVVLVIVPYSQKLKFFGIEFIRFKDTLKKNK